MVGLTLLAAAEAAGLTVELVGDRLRIRGPRPAAAQVEALLAQKPAVLEVLAARATRGELDAVAAAMWRVPCVDCGVILPRGYWYRCAACLGVVAEPTAPRRHQNRRT